MSASHGRRPAGKAQGIIQGHGQRSWNMSAGDYVFFHSGVPTRSPEKKKQRSGLERSSHSEYAPPTNTSSNHLIASNPFADEYSVSPPLTYSQFTKPRYSASGDQQAFRMPFTNPPRMVSHSSASPRREQQTPLPQKSVRKPYDKTHYFNTSIQDNHSFNAEFDQTITFPGQHFRTNHTEKFQISENNPDLRVAHHRSPKEKSNLNVHMDTMHAYISQQTNFRSPKGCSPKTVNRQRQTLDITSFSPASTEDVHSPASDCLYVVDNKGTPVKDCAPQLAKDDVSLHEKCNRWLLHASHSGHLSKGPLYPCGICSGDVDEVQDSIMCEASCRKWFHRTCTGLTEFAHALLTAEASAIWSCDSCMANKDVPLIQIKH
ncbi:pygopus homolog 1 [Pelobates fuscus]|uniref:pygopus homolog 1 n=1 Tax=Pelobates fuscus TaxID=191477 RepID=UPI002FE46933